MRPDGKAIAFENVGLGDLEELAKKLIREAGSNRVIIFNGEMGSGKTTFIKAIGHVLNVKDGMSSPTFSIVNEHDRSTGEKIYHFDFYRLKNELEAYDIGTEEYLDSGSYCLIEWPDKIPSLLPDKYVEVSITKPVVETQNFASPLNTRTISFTTHE
jgi:tRNA threonylcarbamoyladenosine biosynthesis protein TsaE